MQQFEVDLVLQPHELLVRSGQNIGNMGNRGHSFGQHLHFEIRDSQTEKIINPIFFGFDTEIKDTQKPAITNLFVYPLDENSVVNKSKNPFMINLSLQKDGNYNCDKILAKF